MGQDEQVAIVQMWRDLRVVDVRVRVVRNEEEDDRRTRGSIDYRSGVEAIRDRGLPVLVGAVPDNDWDATVAKIGGEGFSLDAVADDGDDLILDVVKTCVSLEVNARPLPS